MACAWGGVAGYGTAMLLSYIVGQRLNPIPYPMRTLAGYVLLAALFYWLLTLLPADAPMWQSLGLATLLVVAYAAVILWKERLFRNERMKK